MQYGRAAADIEAFCQSIPWAPLVSAALRLQFPPAVLHLGLLQCVCRRLLEQMGAASDVFEPGQNVVQGLRAGARFAKILTHSVPQSVPTAHWKISHRLWIDDISQTLKYG